MLENFVPLLESDPDVWWSSYTTNVFGVYLVTRAFAPLLLESTNDIRTVKGVSSLGAHYTAHGASAYETGKLALIRIIEFLSVEEKAKGITAYAIHPGYVSMLGNCQAKS